MAARMRAPRLEGLPNARCTRRAHEGQRNGNYQHGGRTKEMIEVWKLIKITALTSAWGKHRSIRRRQSQRAPGIREQQDLKPTRTVQDFCSQIYH
jgi:hypothetical protein